jgi:tRNA(Ile)-lysidine synthase
VSGPAAEVAEVRLAVRTALAELGGRSPVLVACSGGADSMALAAAAGHPSVRGAREVHAAVVDHGLQAGSAERAVETARLLGEIGVPARVCPVLVGGVGGIEAAARRARYQALRQARRCEDSPVLLGHTLDDQAETVLLGLGRGSGARSLAGMRRWDRPWLRPLLGVRRSTTRAVCAALGLPVWDDPHNVDSRFTRVRLRTEALPLLEDVLAGGVAEALARTAAQLREDVDALDTVAAAARAEASVGADRARPDERAEASVGADPARPGERAELDELDAKALAGHPAAIRRRVLRGWLRDAGVPELTDAHLRRADQLIVGWHGQGGIALPGGMVLVRRRGRLCVAGCPSR